MSFFNKQNKTYIIAELSANHNQEINTAIKLVEEAAKAGANAIKLQTYTADTITLDCKTDIFRIKGTQLWDNQYLYDLYKKAYTPWEWHPILFNKATELGMDYFSSPFDTTAVDFLETLNVPCYKVASCEITDHILLRKIAGTKKPVIISSGMASKEELQEFLESLPQDNFNDIRDFFDTMPKLKHKIEVLNPKTNVKNDVFFVGLSDFFE